MMKWFYEKLLEISNFGLDFIKIIIQTEMSESEALAKTKNPNLPPVQSERIHICKHDEFLSCETLELKN